LQENLGYYFPTLAKEIGFVIDGDYGPVIRHIAAQYLFGWNLEVADIEFITGGECMYVGPDSPEAILWNPLATAAA
jgi:hypothetical protein